MIRGRSVFVALGLAAGLLAGTLGLGPALAHEERALGWLSVLDEVEPNLPGLDVGIAHVTAPAVVVRNRTDRDILVFGIAGEPFLRIGPRGTWANVNSPTIYRSVDPMGGSVPTDVDPTARPRWVELSSASEWSWFDPRIHQEIDASPGNRWTIEARYGGRPVAFRGGFESLERHGHFRSEVDPFEQHPEGLTIRLAEGPVPALFVRNDTGKVLHVPGRAGEPFLRIGPRGVDANLRSPSYYLGGAQVIRDVPPDADPEAAPRWERVADIPVWAWLEYRARAPEFGLSRVGLGDVREEVVSWKLPLRLGSEALPLTGSVTWVPPRGPEAATADTATSGSLQWLPLVLAALVLLAALAVVAPQAPLLRTIARLLPGIRPVE